MPKIESRLRALEQRTPNKRAGLRIFTQDTENPAHYFEGTERGYVAQRLGGAGPYTRTDIDQLSAQGYTCIVVCYGEEIPAPVWG